jgi:hypothetical protein
MSSTKLLSPSLSRRDFLVLVAAAGGGLALAIELPALAADAAPPAPAVRNPAAFLQIGTDDSILITTPSVEMGQGAHTAMPMIVMEELGGDWQRLQVRDAAADKIYDNPLSHRRGGARHVDSDCGAGLACSGARVFSRQQRHHAWSERPQLQFRQRRGAGCRAAGSAAAGAQGNRRVWLDRHFADAHRDRPQG